MSISPLSSKNVAENFDAIDLSLIPTVEPVELVVNETKEIEFLDNTDILLSETTLMSEEQQLVQRRNDFTKTTYSGRPEKTQKGNDRLDSGSRTEDYWGRDVKNMSINTTKNIYYLEGI